MLSADEVPFCLAGFDALDIRRVVLIPGLTGAPSSHRVLRNLLRAGSALIGLVILRLLPGGAPACDKSRPEP